MGTEKTNGIPGFSNEPPGLSMFSWFGYFQTAPERFRIIRDAGFDGVMLAWEDEEEPVRITKEHQTELARMEGLLVGPTSGLRWGCLQTVKSSRHAQFCNFFLGGFALV